MFHESLAKADHLLAQYGVAAVFLAILVEGAGVPAPGQTLLIAAALLAARGEISIAALLFAGAMGSAGGVAAGWAIGRYGGRRLLERFAGPRLARLELLFVRYGGAVVAFGRFIDGVRQLSGLASGALGVPFGLMLAWDVFGALVWTSFWGLGAYWIGRDFTEMNHLWREAGPVALTLTIVLVAGVIGWIALGRLRLAPWARPAEERVSSTVEQNRKPVRRAKRETDDA